jgi:hypothetical protein
MACEKLLAGFARYAQDQIAGGHLVGIAGKLCRQGRAQRRRLLPVGRERGAIRSEITADARPGRKKCRGRARRNADTREHCRFVSIGRLCTSAHRFLMHAPAAQEKSFAINQLARGNGDVARALTEAAGRSTYLPCRS